MNYMRTNKLMIELHGIVQTNFNFVAKKRLLGSLLQFEKSVSKIASMLVHHHNRASEMTRHQCMVILFRFQCTQK